MPYLLSKRAFPAMSTGGLLQAYPCLLKLMVFVFRSFNKIVKWVHHPSRRHFLMRFEADEKRTHNSLLFILGNADHLAQYFAIESSSLIYSCLTNFDAGIPTFDFLISSPLQRPVARSVTPAGSSSALSTAFSRTARSPAALRRPTETSMTPSTPSSVRPALASMSRAV